MCKIFDNKENFDFKENYIFQRIFQSEISLFM